MEKEKKEKMEKKNMPLRRGQVYWCDLGNSGGHEIHKRRPVVVVQNDVGNIFSTTTIVVPMTTRNPQKKYLTRCSFWAFGKMQTVCAEQIRVVAKERLRGLIGELTDKQLNMVDEAVAAAFSKGNQVRGDVEQGQVYMVNFEGVGSEEWGRQPSVVVQNNACSGAPTTIVVPLIKERKTGQPTHYNFRFCGKIRTASAEQIRAVDKDRLEEFVGAVSEKDFIAIREAVKVAVDKHLGRKK